MERYTIQEENITNKISDSSKLLGIKVSALKLCVLALFVSIILSSSDVILNGTRYVYSPEQSDGLKLSGSVIWSIWNGEIPPRTSLNLVNGYGVPFHQFYAPLCHFFVAILGIITGDLLLGYAMASIIILTLAFLSTHALIKYLTFSNIYALISAFIFVTGPYLFTDRVLRGDFPEYCGFCLTPLLLYFILRAINSGRLKYWILALIVSASLALTHLITFINFYIFLSLFLFIHLLQILAKNSNNKKVKGKKYAGKLFVLFTILIATLIIDMYYFLPIIFYNDLAVKGIDLASKTMVDLKSTVSPLSLLSVFNMPFITPMTGENIIVDARRFQIGFLVLVSYLSYIYLLYKTNKSLYYWSFVLTSSIILILIFKPLIFPNTPIFSFETLSYRMILDFQLISVIMGALAMLVFFRENPSFHGIGQKIFAVIIICFSLIFIRPYLFSNMTHPNYPHITTEEDFYNESSLSDGNANYIRIPPPDDDPRWIKEGITLKRAEGLGDEKVFALNLDDYYTSSKEDGVYLNVLYYPGLMDIDVFVNGKTINCDLDTFWVKKSVFNIYINDDAPFHGLKLSGLPRKGLLEVKTKFIGSRLGNYISLFSILLIILYCLYSYGKNKAKKNKRLAPSLK
jgi:hypothetical protein